MLTLTQPVTRIVFDKKPTPPAKMTPAERKYFNAMKLVAKEIEKILKSTLTSVTKAKGIKAISLLKKYSKSMWQQMQRLASENNYLTLLDTKV